MYKKLVCLLCTCALSTTIKAQEKDEGRVLDTLTLYFDQGKALLGSKSKEELQLVDRLRQLRLLVNNPSFRIRSLRFGASTSPEGNSQSNKQLAQRRGKTLKTYLRAELPGLSLDSASVVDLSWSAFEDLVRCSSLEHKDKALEIVRNTPIWVVRSGKVVDSRKRQLMTLDKGRFWQQIQKELFPKLRFAQVEVVYELTQEPVADTTTIAPPVLPQEELPKIEPTIEPVVETAIAPEVETRTIHTALRTNLLYDAILIPNIGLELSLGNRWSIIGSWAYAWWHTDLKHYYWRLYGGDLEFRRYWGKRSDKYGSERPFTGHHLGLYAGLVTYDFELGGRGYLGEHWSYYGGLAYGYSLPIARRINLDFTLGIGYLGGQYKEYLPNEDCYVWQVTKQRNYIGPTKAELSLVWLLDFTRKLRKSPTSR